MYEDKTLVCKDCGAEFVFTAGEQEFYAEKGFQNEPTRCKAAHSGSLRAQRGPSRILQRVLCRPPRIIADTRKDPRGIASGIFFE